MTPHFSVEEFDQHGWPEHPSVPYPSEWIADRLTPLCESLEIVRRAMGNLPVTVISGYRTKAYNERVGGALRSQHCEGRAADVWIEGVKERDLLSLRVLQLSSMGALPLVKGIGLYRRWVHLDVRPNQGTVIWDNRKRGEV